MNYMGLPATLMLYVGLAIFNIIIHMGAITTSNPNMASFLAGLFVITITAYIGALIFGFVFVLIYLLKWITWYVTTPDWLKKGGGKQ